MYDRWLYCLVRRLGFHSDGIGYGIDTRLENSDFVLDWILSGRLRPVTSGFILSFISFRLTKAL